MNVAVTPDAARASAPCRCADVEKRRIPVVILDSVDDLDYTARGWFVFCRGCGGCSIEREVN